MPKPVAKSIRFTPSLWAAIEAEAARQNRSVNNLIAVVMTEFLRNQPA